MHTPFVQDSHVHQMMLDFDFLDDRSLQLLLFWNIHVACGELVTNSESDTFFVITRFSLNLS
jgi:hypothetical protein